MTGLQRYGIRSGCPACGPNYADHDLIPIPDGMPDEPGFVVLAADAEAAITSALADDRAILTRAENAWREEIRLRLHEQYEQGQRDALDAAVQRVEALIDPWPNTSPGLIRRGNVFAAIKGDSHD